MRTRLLAAFVALIALVVIGAVLQDADHKTTFALADPATSTTSSTSSTTTTVVPETTTQAPPPPATVAAAAVAPTTRATTPPAPTTTQSPIVPAPTLRTNAALTPGNPAAFNGFGAWIDVYDWSNEYTNNKPTVGPSDIDRMARFGVQTLYIQCAKKNSKNDIVDYSLLKPILKKARDRGMTIIAWYAPSLEDPNLDLHRMLSMSDLDVDGLGVDIESRAISDPPERSRRLVDLSIALRQRRPGLPIAAVVMPAAQMEVVNPNYWPGFPYREIAPAYDVWMPMSYWTSRKADSPYRNAYTYTAENIDRLRNNVGRGDLPVHPIGGIGDVSSDADMQGFWQAAAERGSIGGSIYDYRTTQDSAWPILRQFRR